MSNYLFLSVSSSRAKVLGDSRLIQSHEETSHRDKVKCNSCPLKITPASNIVAL